MHVKNCLLFLKVNLCDNLQKQLMERLFLQCMETLRYPAVVAAFIFIRQLSL